MKPVLHHIDSLWTHMVQEGEASCGLKMATAVGGGCINDSYRLEADSGVFFLKVNDAVRYPGMFDAERKGLELLRSANALRVPEVFANGHFEGKQYLLCEWIEQGVPSNKHNEHLGRGLARLHHCTGGFYGLDHDNWIGSLPQANRYSNSWEDFFIEHRIIPQLRLSERRGLLTARLRNLLDRLISRLPELFPKEQPALLHGDLWAGNAMADEKGGPVIFDPAVYFGHREMEIAMMQLFGGFNRQVFDFYIDEYPLAPDWRSRTALCQIYPLLVHANLFGGGYFSQTEAAIRTYV